MSNNYPSNQKNQHDPLEFDYKEYLDTSSDQLGDNNLNDTTPDVELDMSSSIHDMRREFKRTVKKLRSLYTKNETRALIYQYQFDNRAPARMRLAKRNAVG